MTRRLARDRYLSVPGQLVRRRYLPELRRVTRNDCREAVRSVVNAERTAVVLLDEGHTLGEIAHEMQISRRQAEGAVRRGLARLRRRMSPPRDR